MDSQQLNAFNQDMMTLPLPLLSSQTQLKMTVTSMSLGGRIAELMTTKNMLKFNSKIRIDEIIDFDYYHNSTQQQKKKIICTKFQQTHSLSHSRLFLLSQKNLNSDGNDWAITHALLVQEYKENKENDNNAGNALITHSYIQYIDTTGHFTPRQHQSQLTRSFVQSYISAVREKGIQFIHITSHAKPEYLFSHSSSASNEKKKPLNSSKLVIWWLKCLSATTEIEGKSFKLYYFCPTQEKIEMERDIRLAINNSPATDVIVGFPYKKEAKASDCIPVFEDDPIYEHFTSISSSSSSSQDHDDCLSVEEFFATLSCRPEMNEKTGFFVIENENKSGWNIQKRCDDQEDAGKMGQSMLGKVFEMIGNDLDYSGLTAFQSSCRKILLESNILKENLSDNGNHFVTEFDVKWDGPDDPKGSQSTQPQAPQSLQQINTIQPSLIKRKKLKIDNSAEEINNKNC